MKPSGIAVATLLGRGSAPNNLRAGQDENHTTTKIVLEGGIGLLANPVWAGRRCSFMRQKPSWAAGNA